ncbi:MAG: hypothetical protein ACM3ZT_08485 [Bacillota bacterium]
MRAVIVSVCTLLLIAACAAPASRTAPPPPAPPVEDGVQPQAGLQENKTPFISKSAVFFPGESADFELVRKYQYPQAMDGVQLTYGYAPLPAAKIDFFVFAAGRAPQDYALKQGMARIRGEISAATKAGLYSDTAFGDESGVSVVSPDGPKLPGGRLQLAYTAHGIPSVSVAYMFYKQLYFVELRLTAPDSVGVDALTKAGDLAAQEIVPRLHMLSEGGCETIDVDLGDGAADPNSLLKAMSQGVAQREAEGCPPVKEHPPADFEPKPGEGAMLLTYTADDWQ